MITWSITGFTGINNVQEPSAITQPDLDAQGNAVGPSALRKCINYDIDDAGGLIQRDTSQAIFSATYDDKLTQTLGGRTFTADGTYLRFTKPWSSELDPRRSTIPYDANIILIQEVEDGLWLSTTESITFHKGTNPTRKGGFTPISEYDFPAIAGTGEKVHHSKLDKTKDGFVAVFATTKGICIGDQNGNLTNISEGVFSYQPGQRGISYLKEDNGMVQYQVKMINRAADSYNEQERKVAITVDTQP